MYVPEPLKSAADSVATDVALKAIAGQLTIFAGAGLSASEPTGLPGAESLARRIAAELDGVVPFDGVDRNDLLSVADAVAGVPQGLSLLKRTVLSVADLLLARPNYGHHVVAMLLCEGVATILETNYDTCIERAAQPEMPAVVRSDGDLLNAQRPALLKAHGCATHRSSMLVTSDELRRPPLWADATVAARLSQDQVLFVGTGSVADYVRSRVESVLDAVGSAHLLLVDPRLAHWDDDERLDWRLLVPDLPPEQRIAIGASEFLDSVLRAYAQRGFRDASSLVSGHAPEHRQRIGFEAVLDALAVKDGVAAVRWLRDASWRCQPGNRVVGSTAATEGLLALGALIGDEWRLEVGDGGWVSVTQVSSTTDGQAAVPAEWYLLVLLVTHSADGTATVREARHRVEEAKRLGKVAPGASVVVVVAGSCLGSLGVEQIQLARGEGLTQVVTKGPAVLAGLPTDLVGTGGADHLIDGPTDGPMYFVAGGSFTEALAS